MNIEDFLQAHSDICDNLKEIVKKKNADYSGDDDAFNNLRSVETLNITSTENGFLTRMSDKFNRIISFVKKGVLLVEDEKIEDTLLDLANYAILMNIYIKNKKNNGV